MWKDEQIANNIYEEYEDDFLIDIICNIADNKVELDFDTNMDLLKYIKELFLERYNDSMITNAMNKNNIKMLEFMPSNLQIKLPTVESLIQMIKDDLVDCSDTSFGLDHVCRTFTIISREQIEYLIDVCNELAIILIPIFGNL